MGGRSSRPGRADEVSALLAGLARDHLRMETLASRGADSLDFREVSVWGVRAALLAAFDAGRAAGRGGPGLAWNRDGRLIEVAVPGVEEAPPLDATSSAAPPPEFLRGVRVALEFLDARPTAHAFEVAAVLRGLLGETVAPPPKPARRRRATEG